MTKAAHTNRIRESTGSKVFNVINAILLIFLCFLTLYPIWYCLVASFTATSYLSAHQGIMFIPHMFTTSAYRLAFTHPLLLSGYRNILIVLVVSVPLNIILTVFTGYFLASRDVLLKPVIQFMIMFTMFFNGGMIPTFLNIRDLGLYNTLWTLILPGAISVYNCIICRTAIQSVPASLNESAYLDGANDLVIVFRITLPLIMPTIAVLILYYGIGHWNAWFPASIYLQDNDKLPIQNIMRSILIANSNLLNAAASETDKVDDFAETIKYSTIILTTVPVLCIYPFLQKYFVKGVMIGAVKG